MSACCPSHALACIVPPYMLRVLALRGDPATVAMANSLLAHDQDLRHDRAALIPTSPDPIGTADGQTAFASPGMATGTAVFRPDRRIHDGNLRAALPGRPVRAEGSAPSGIPDADLAYDSAGQVFSLFAQEYGRNSLDGRGMPLVATVRHRLNYNNAFWDGQQMAYGTGDGRIFRTFLDLSVMAHEMTHGVIQHSGGLIYENQSGALNEHVADVFGTLAQQRVLGQDAHQADWLIGRGILGPQIRGVALRSLKAPGTAYADDLLGQDPQPWHMTRYNTTTDDNGGVHINSGIPNHAFYLFSSYLGGPAWQVPGRIWYHALQTLNNPMASFSDFADQTLRSAAALSGTGAMDAILLRRAWTLVGVAV